MKTLKWLFWSAAADWYRGCMFSDMAQGYDASHNRGRWQACLQKARTR